MITKEQKQRVDSILLELHDIIASDPNSVCVTAYDIDGYNCNMQSTGTGSNLIELMSDMSETLEVNIRKSFDDFLSNLAKQN